MSVRPAHLGLRHLALQVTSFEAMKRFYVDLLGFRVEWEPDAGNVYLTSGTDNLALHRSKGITKTENSTLDHFGLVVRVPAEVDAWASFFGARRGFNHCAAAKPSGRGPFILFFRS